MEKSKIAAFLRAVLLKMKESKEDSPYAVMLPSDQVVALGTDIDINSLVAEGYLLETKNQTKTFNWYSVTEKGLNLVLAEDLLVD